MVFHPVLRARLQASLALGATLVLWWRIPGVLPAAAAGIAGCLALLAWISPPHYAPIQRVLDGLVQLLLQTVTWLLLGLIYLGLFCPLRLWRRLTRQEALQRRPDPTATSYLQALPAARADRFERQF